MNDPRTSQKKPALNWIVGTSCLGLLLALLVQWRTISKLRRENESLRVQSKAVAASRVDQPIELSAGEAAAIEQAQKDRTELLRLRDEVRRLREQAAQPGSDRSVSMPQPVTPAQIERQYRNDKVRELALAVMQGDSTALESLAKLMTTARTMNPDEQAAVRADIKSVFEALGNEAGKGNTTALKAVWQATRLPDLQGFAVRAMGDAAGQGNEEALQPLLDPDSYLITRSSAIAALKPAADAGNARAIQALATAAADQNQRALWLLAAQGLENAAGAGNSAAIQALAGLASDENENIRKAAVLGLEAAALKKQPKAEEALRKLGWR